MAVATSIDTGVEGVAKVADYGTSATLEGKVGRFVADMALVAVTGSCKGGFAVMAAAARLALLHIGHGGLTGALAVVVLLGVAVAALVCLGMEVMAEYGVIDRL